MAAGTNVAFGRLTYEKNREIKAMYYSEELSVVALSLPLGGRCRACEADEAFHVAVVSRLPHGKIGKTITRLGCKQPREASDCLLLSPRPRGEVAGELVSLTERVVKGFCNI